MKDIFITIVWLSILILVQGCDQKSPEADEIDGSVGSSDQGREPEDMGLGKDLFDPDHLIEVAIELEAEEWDQLRLEGRSLPKSIMHCGDPDFEYTYFETEVTVEGDTLENVGVRKKGYLGSISLVRPSFKVNFGNFVDNRVYAGIRRMTLNNDRQDPSHTHQCMSYALFRQAGVVAPRCNFAHVTVNGQDLGFYSHVESIDKRFLARHFDDNDGNLYEVQRADFSDAAIEYFEIKTNEEDNDRSDLKAVVEALEAEDEDLLEELEKVIDVDAFLTYWAMEVIVGHWDGATGNANNHFLYHDPTTDKFYFIPWGTDGTFEFGQVFLELAGVPVPDSVYALARIPYRLYSNLETRRLYHERLQELLDEVWDEEALLDEVDRIGELTSADPTGLEEQREFIRRRRAAIEEELVGDGPTWAMPPGLDSAGRERRCRPPTPVSGRFVTTWGDLDELDLDPERVADNRLEISLNGEEVEMAAVLASAGLSTDPAGTVGVPNTRVIGIPVEDYPPGLVVTMAFNTPSLFETGEVPFHGFEVSASVVQLVDREGTDYRMLGFIGDGKIILDEAGTDPGDPVEGGFEGLFARVY